MPVGASLPLPRFFVSTAMRASPNLWTPINGVFGVQARNGEKALLCNAIRDIN
jgi:hypothetical protein